MWLFFENTEMLNCFINVLRNGLPNSTFRSCVRERPVPKITFMRMTEVLCNDTRAFCRPKRGEGCHGASHSIFGIKAFLSRQKMSFLKVDIKMMFASKSSFVYL